ncbi:MAG: hypothetical protein FWD34_00250 [Oscillospiraceae bacterium]|nr:hypothetical protein [Oscillospiraceae bacterium]
MKEYTLTREENEALQDILYEMVQKGKKQFRLMCVVMAIPAFLACITLIAITFLQAEPNPRMTSHVMIFIPFFLMICLMPLLLLKFEFSVFKNALDLLKSGKLNCFVTPLVRADRINNNYCFYIADFKKPVNCLDERHYHRANKGDEILVVHVSKRRYIGYLREQLLII